MRNILCSSITFSLLCLESISVCAQTARPNPAPPLEVTIIIQQQQVRFIAPSGTQELRLEVYGQAGELIYDSDVATGPELAWSLQKSQGQAVASGLYAYRLTVKEATAESPRIQSGHFIVDRGQDRDPLMDRVWITSQGAGGVGSSITGVELTVAASGEVTVAGAGVPGTRNGKSDESPGAKPTDKKVDGEGTPGRITKWTDANTIGDSTITESDGGNVGIGTTAPTQKLQVAGVIHSTTGGIKFPDGTVQTTASVVGGITTVTASGPLVSSGGATPNISLTGVVPIANGGTGASTQNFVDLTTGQTIGGTKTFSDAIIGNITGNAAAVTNGVYTTGDQTISGNKTFTNAVNSNSQYNINGNRVLANPGFDNFFAGVGAGANNTGVFNSFFGPHAGSANTIGSGNSFFELDAGRSNNAGGENSFFGERAGFSNATGGQNSFFGNKAGYSNTTAINNSFFGYAAGQSSTTGIDNSFFGSHAGVQNTAGEYNSFFGFLAGSSNTTGRENTFIGNSAGDFNTTENNNTFIGSQARGAVGVINSTAIGANASVTQSNSLVLGSDGVSVGIGVSGPAAKLDVRSGDVYIGSADQGVILKSPDGATCCKLTIDDSGALVLTPITCP